MKAEQASFKSLVDNAYSGKLVLPEFQRDWKWTRSKVLRLFDSVRKNYPIGGFLTLEKSNIKLSHRLFEGIEVGQSDIESYVLDGQQRITAGLMLHYGTGKSHYFLDLEGLWKAAMEAGLDYSNTDRLRKFADDLDEEDKYIKGRRWSADPESLLQSRHLLWTPFLTDDNRFLDAKDRYVERYPERARFMERLIGPFFKLGSEPIVPVTVLDSDMPVEAITRVFETLNTSGQRLTPVEIVVAVLFAHNIHLRQELEDFQNQTKYYGNIETTGEIFLQTIALLAGENPKKNTLPRTMTPVNYTKFKNNAIAHLELAGEFLSSRFGMGLDSNNALVPYPAMLPPLGIALSEIEQKYTQPSAEKAHWQRNLERWFVGSIIKQRYTESQPATQQRDTREILRWIREGDDLAPDWLAEDVRVGSLETLPPSSAIGKLIACLISLQQPKDPLNDEPVGRKDADITSLHSHHIFPKGFCENHIPEWDRDYDKYDLALNVMPITKETNRTWNKMDPANQVTDVSNLGGAGLVQSYSPFFIDENCLKIMSKPNKTKDDFALFVKERGRLIQEHIAQRWGFIPDAQQVEDEEEI